MRRALIIFLTLTFLFIPVFAGILDEVDDPSAYGSAMGGALYALYAGPQSIAYNPAGISEGGGGLFFSHIEHYFGTIRNEFLSGTYGFNDLYIGSAIESTYPLNLDYFQYILSGTFAYRMGNNALGMNVNYWMGSDIVNGVSMDFGGITKIGELNLGLVVKNAFASITWVGTVSNVETYPAEIITGLDYSRPSFDLNAFANFTSDEAGVGLRIPLTDFFSVMGGYNVTFGIQQSNSLSTGIMIKNYFGFDIFVSYTFQNLFEFSDTINPLYVSFTYNFGGK